MLNCINKITPELQKKRSIAIEVLDMCLKHNIIDIFQHSSGIKLRWFYTIMFGAPTIQSRFTTLESHKSKHYDEKFLQFVGKQYYSILKKLKKVNAHKIVLNICIYNELPKFLYRNHNNYCNQKEKFIQRIFPFFKNAFFPAPTDCRYIKAGFR